jgi:ribosome-associated translation inhibitor RaiA
MKIIINTDNNIQGREQMTAHYEGVLTEALSRFNNSITRLEVHLGDENSHKQSPDDKRCMIEARVEGLQPIAVTHKAETIHEAVSGAVDKLKKSLDSAIGKMRAY